jgi:hypothetical protein
MDILPKYIIILQKSAFYSFALKGISAFIKDTRNSIGYRIANTESRQGKFRDLK